MMPIFFEPTAKKRELSLVAAGRSRSFGTLGKPKAAIWRPPRHLGSKRKHHTALAGVPRRGGFSFSGLLPVHPGGFQSGGGFAEGIEEGRSAEAVQIRNQRNSNFGPESE